MFLNKKISIYLILTLSIFIGYLLNENSSGGGKIDARILFPYINNFALDFEKGFSTFANNPATIIHSPIFYIFVSFFLKINNSLIFINLIYILISSTLPYIFYLILKNKYNFNHDYLFYISLIIFFSPYFRSSGIWLLGDNLSLIFFSLSIYYYVKTLKNQAKIRNYFLCLFFLILCCYIRYYYSVFVIFYFYNFYQKLDKVYSFKLFLFCFFLSIPALIYFYYIFISYDFFDSISLYGKLNIYSNSLIILSLFLFYLLPIILTELDLIIKHIKNKYIYFLVIFFIFFSLYLIDLYNLYETIVFSPRGGGVFIKIFNQINFDTEILMTLVSFLSFIALDYFSRNNRFQNYFLIIILIFSLPLFSFYQKYLDPLIFLIIFGLLQSETLKEILSKKKINFKYFFGYYISFYIFSLIYYIDVK